MRLKKFSIRVLIHWIIFLIFLSFAWLQLNDPDPAVWVLVYSIVALLFGISNFTTIPRVILYAVLGAMIVFALFHIPYFIEWLKSPNKSELFGDMVYEKPYIEGSREFMGLLIAISAVLYLLKRGNNS